MCVEQPAQITQEEVRAKNEPRTPDPFPGHTINPSSPRGLVSQALLHPFTAVCSPPPASARTSQGGSVLKETDLHTKFSRPQDRTCPSSEPLPAGGKDGSLGRDLVLHPYPTASLPTPPPSSCHYILELLPPLASLLLYNGIVAPMSWACWGHIHQRCLQPPHCAPAIFCDCCQPC